jgi:hypothetical protein
MSSTFSPPADLTEHKPSNNAEMCSTLPSPSAMTGTLTTFHLFKKLPTEICDEMWKLALLHLPSRNIEVYYNFRLGQFVSCALAPTLLHVCSDSQKAALKRYKPFNFGGKFAGTHVD